MSNKEFLSKLQFGAFVNISKKLKRRRKGSWALWDEVSYKSNRCIFLGTRTLSNGVREFDSEYGWAFYPKEYLQAALVCPNKNSKPIYVPFDAIEISNWYNGE